jgi:hypothetical protein
LEGDHAQDLQVTLYCPQIPRLTFAEQRLEGPSSRLVVDRACLFDCPRAPARTRTLDKSSCSRGPRNRDLGAANPEEPKQVVGDAEGRDSKGLTREKGAQPGAR